jgi:AraC family transcriptional regulator of adaptative response / DNA-3-methyladenine glycosylase II
LALPGIGPWTVEYLAMRALHDRDAYPEGDLVLQRALEVKTAKQARELGQAWAPVRAYAVFHLWTASAYLP